MYQDAVVLLPGLLGFGHFGGFYHFADRVAAALRGALELEAGRPIPVLPFTVFPPGSLSGRQEVLLGSLTRLDATLGGVERLHLVGHGAGGVDAYLLTQERPFGGGPADPRGVRRKIRSVITIAAPHYGTGLANTNFADFLGNPLAHMAGLPDVGRTVLDVLRSVAGDPHVPTTVAGTLHEWGQSFAFLGQMLQNRDLIQALRPERMADLQSRCRPDPEVSAKLTCFVTAAPTPSGDPTKSDAVYRDLHALTAKGSANLAPSLKDAQRLLSTVAPDKIIKSAESTWPANIEVTTNDGLVTSASQLVHPDRPDELGAVVLADHGDVLGHYPRVDFMTSVGGRAEAGKILHGGLFHSGANFRDDQFFELYRRIAGCIRDAR